jgi:hypothetical protein
MPPIHPKRLALAAAFSFGTASSIAHAQVAIEVPTTVARSPSAEVDRPVEAPIRHETLDQIPIAAYTYSAAGVGGPNLGAYGYFNFLAGAKLGATSGSAVPAGGVLVYGAPIDRVTLVIDGSRSTINGAFAPSFAAIVRPVGHADRGFSLGLLAKYKIESFGDPDLPNSELEHEVEGGLLIGYAAAHWHLDGNAIVGFGLNDSHEVDVEGRLRVGRDLGERVRIGIDGQVRGRAHGTELLAGNRTADFQAGPQLLVGLGHFYTMLTAGPSTTGVGSGVGFTTIAAVGGTTL